MALTQHRDNQDREGDSRVVCQAGDAGRANRVSRAQCRLAPSDGVSRIANVTAPCSLMMDGDGQPALWMSSVKMTLGSVAVHWTVCGEIRLAMQGSREGGVGGRREHKDPRLPCQQAQPRQPKHYS